MKTRSGFVSNSSSSSFVASLSKLTNEELEKLLAYQYSDENEDGWSISVDQEVGLVTGFTTMDNGTFSEWIEKNGYNKIRFEGGY